MSDDVYFRAMLTQNGSNGDFIVSNGDAGAIMCHLETGTPFLIWVNRADIGLSSGLLAVPRQGGLSVRLSPQGDITVDPHGRPIPPEHAAQVPGSKLVGPKSFAARVLVPEWAGGQKGAPVNGADPRPPTAPPPAPQGA